MKQRAVYIVQGFSKDVEEHEANRRIRDAIELMLNKLEFIILNPRKNDNLCDASKIQVLPERIEKLISADLVIIVGSHGLSPFSRIEMEIVKSYDIPYCYDYSFEAIYKQFDEPKKSR